MKAIVKTNQELIAQLILANTTQVFVEANRSNRLYKVTPVVINIAGEETSIEVSRLIPRELRVKAIETGERIMFTVVTGTAGLWEMDNDDSIFGFIKRGETFQSFKQAKVVELPVVETAAEVIAEAEKSIVQKAIDRASNMTDKEFAMLSEIVELGMAEKELIACDRSTAGVLGSLIKKGFVKVTDGLVAAV